ncbi:MAG TPA: GspE/PulE family protein [Verrucomicrobiota bacterium]|nr:type II secretion system protein GspE [Verrucomicrobiales bacterium]HRI13897.1 GspE/PulE family protein [Verrucomicrobiota bacterium]
MNRKLHPDSLVGRLLDDGLVTASQVELAETEQRRRGGSVAKVLSELGFITPEQFTAVLAREAGIPLADPASLRPDPEVAGLIPVEVARRLKLLPLGRREGTLIVAMADPCDVVALDHLRRCVATEVEILAAPERAIHNALDASEQVEPGIQTAINRWLAEEAPKPATTRINVVTAPPGLESAPVVQLVQEVLARAIEMGASDVHFEPAEQWLRVRVRLDGLLFPDVLIPKPLQSAVVARLKVLGDLDVAETRVPQDGRTTLTAHRQRYNLRISSLPTQYGESLVVRLLPAESAVPSLAQLGFDANTADQLRRAASNPHGVIIVTGPTGSGKTTTLYALLNELNQPDTGVFSLEDPVEMPVAGVRQTQIHEEAGLTYAVALRALLRQDPDVILVGETRDSETAQLMVRAAMTGHLVLTTLHTNDAIGAIPRLIDLGVERCLLSGSLVAVLAQRLVRCLCPDCRAPVPDAARYYAEQGIAMPPASKPRLWRATGCAKCRNSGYRGRRALFELLTFDEGLHALVARNSAYADLVNAARESGMRPLFEVGLRQVVEGATTLEELRRVTQSESREHAHIPI